MKKIELPYTCGPKDVIHTDTTIWQDGTVEQQHYLLNPVERWWDRVVVWWFWDWMANVRCIRCNKLLTLKEARCPYHPCNCPTCDGEENGHT
jgi:hypothetical protein